MCVHTESTTRNEIKRILPSAICQLLLSSLTRWHNNKVEKVSHETTRTLKNRSLMELECVIAWMCDWIWTTTSDGGCVDGKLWSQTQHCHYTTEMLSVTFTGMQNIINRRSAVAKPPKKTFVGVAGSGLSRGHRVEAIITTFPERNYDSFARLLVASYRTWGFSFGLFEIETRNIDHVTRLTT